MHTCIYVCTHKWAHLCVHIHTHIIKSKEIILFNMSMKNSNGLKRHDRMFPGGVSVLSPTVSFTRSFFAWKKEAHDSIGLTLWSKMTITQHSTITLWVLSPFRVSVPYFPHMRHTPVFPNPSNTLLFPVDIAMLPQRLLHWAVTCHGLHRLPLSRVTYFTQ